MARLSILCEEALDNNGRTIRLDDVTDMCKEFDLFYNVYIAEDVVVCDIHFEDKSMCHCEFELGFDNRYDGYEPLVKASAY